MGLDIAAPLHIDVEDDILSLVQLFLHLSLQRTVEATGIHLLVFEELPVVYALLELLG